MSEWTPEYRILIDSVNATNLTLIGFSLTSGRTNINVQPQASYVNLSIINKENNTYNWNVNSSLTVEVKNNTGTWISLFGGKITDIATGVKSAGSIAYTTEIQMIALGGLSKLTKAVWSSSLSQDYDGNQIYTILTDLFVNNWNEVSPALTWSTYSSTTTWNSAENIGLGEIDRPGQYQLEQRSADPIDFNSIVQQIANSALGYLYEDRYGNVSYADAIHRQNYLATNGYTEIDGSTAFASGIKQSIKVGNVINKYSINYGNNFGNNVTAQDATSQGLYGLNSLNENSLLHDNTDAQRVVDRYIALRAYPRPQFESITFPLQNPEISSSTRNVLLNIFMGLPIKIINLPPNIYGGEFSGFVEGWNMRSTKNGLQLQIMASPTEFSLIAQNWAQVTPTESWNTLNNALQWINATGVIN
jgi:hypothetical protein